MKAISLWQPFASAIPLGLKKIETRHWTTNYRGDLAIHAAQKNTLLLREIAQKGGLRWEDLPLGQVVAVVRVFNVGPSEVLDYIVDDTERYFGDYGKRRYGWLLDNIRPVAPFPWKGGQGFFNIPDWMFYGRYL